MEMSMSEEEKGEKFRTNGKVRLNEEDTGTVD